MKTGLGSLVIANTGTDSGELAWDRLRFLKNLTIHGPSALTGTVTVQVNPARSGGTWVTLQSGGVDVTVAAGKATVIEPVPFGRLRLKSSSAEGAERTFPLVGGEV